MLKILHNTIRRLSSHGLALVVLIALAMPHTSLSQSAGEIQKEIDGHSVQIEQLNKEIAAYEKQLT